MLDCITVERELYLQASQSSSLMLLESMVRINWGEGEKEAFKVRATNNTGHKISKLSNKC